MSKRGDQWNKFAHIVSHHIEEYTVSQYGDYPEDQATHFTTDDLVKAMQRYLNRYGRGARGREESIRDILKVAHYAQMLHMAHCSEKYPHIELVQTVPPPEEPGL